MQTLFEGDNFVVREDETGNLEITYFNDNHWAGCLHIEITGEMYEE